MRMWVAMNGIVMFVWMFMCVFVFFLDGHCRALLGRGWGKWFFPGMPGSFHGFTDLMRHMGRMRVLGDNAGYESCFFQPVWDEKVQDLSMNPVCYGAHVQFARGQEPPAVRRFRKMSRFFVGGAGNRIGHRPLHPPLDLSMCRVKMPCPSGVATV